jgi:hypothetical protein
MEATGATIGITILNVDGISVQAISGAAGSRDYERLRFVIADRGSLPSRKETLR